jgi:hypothetical protein
MADLAHYRRLQTTFEELLRDLAATWPAADVEYVREEVGYAEYGDALENLVALSRRNGRTFSPDQLQRVKSLATEMGMEGTASLAPLLAQLRETRRTAS